MAIKINSMAGAVAHTINALGFNPTNSVVFHFMTGMEVLCTLRIDAMPSVAPRVWTGRVAEILDQIPASPDGVMIISYEDEQAMTLAQYDELGDVLARRGAPIKTAILVTGGKIMDYEGDGSDLVDFTEALTDPVAISHMVTAPATRSALDAPQCKGEAAQVAAVRESRFRKVRAWEIKGLEALAKHIHDELTDQLTAYIEFGEVSEEQAGWIAGTFQNKSGRDFVMAGMATDENDLEKVAKTLLGELDISDSKRFKTAADMLYDALNHITGTSRANVLVGLAWARWMMGKGTEAKQFVALAKEIEPEHRLAKLLDLFFDHGAIAKSSTARPTN